MFNQDFFLPLEVQKEIKRQNAEATQANLAAMGWDLPPWEDEKDSDKFPLY